MPSEGKRRALACAECHYKRDINVNCDDDGCDGQLVEVPFASEDNDGSAMTNTDDDKRSDMRMAQDESGLVAAAACSIMRSGEVEEKELILVKAQTIFDERSDGASATKPLDQYTTEEGRVLVRLRYLLTPESLPITGLCAIWLFGSSSLAYSYRMSSMSLVRHISHRYSEGQFEPQ